MVTLMRRLRREEEGYSLVIAMLLLAIMAVLLVVGLDAGTASLKQSSLAVEWSKALTVAEAGLNDSITRLGESRSAANPCNMSGSTVCTGEDRKPVGSRVTMRSQPAASAEAAQTASSKSVQPRVSAR